MADTYSGATLAVFGSAPSSNDATGFGALTFVSGACALREVPGIMREWGKVTDDLVCQNDSYERKGGAKWAPVTFTLSRIPGDAAQAIYTTLEADRSGVGSFKLTLSGGDIIYFQAQVSKFALIDGGSRDTVEGVSVELLIQNTPVYVAA